MSLKIKASKKMSEQLIIRIASEILSKIEIHPGNPYSWKELEAKYGYSRQSLAAKEDIYSAFKESHMRKANFDHLNNSNIDITSSNSIQEFEEKIRTLNEKLINANKALKENVKQIQYISVKLYEVHSISLHDLIRDQYP